MSDDMENFSNELDSIIDNLSKLRIFKKRGSLASTVGEFRKTYLFE